MFPARKAAMVAAFCGIVLLAGQAQQTPDNQSARPHHKTTRRRTLTADDRKAVLATAMDWKQIHHTGRDCSHLVHDIYEEAGFPYRYADSEDLYTGAQGFQRISRPQAGDVIVWHGHAGIVIHPARHTFFSFLSSSGPGIDNYRSRYWRGRGEARFYRYIKAETCPGCTLARRNDY
ncbi:MAG TPA: NlpC/P60 family protein [Candidatus Eisenbacteria bacterium]|nr:NlpC/P60 family protein [Candidatus Eisenbacteria bacterium]